jgi:hypothetical protein
MKNQRVQPKVEGIKVASISALYTVSMLIIVIGLTFGGFSIIKNISFFVLGSTIHGAIFGIIIVFLGIRYFNSVRKLKNEVYKSSSRFSWSNFTAKQKKVSKFNKTEPILTKYWMRG